MNYFPFENAKFLSNLKSDELVRHLSDSIERVHPSKFKSPSRSSKSYYKPYQGTISNNEFTVLRNISYENSFRPVIHGTIREFLSHTEVSIEMKLHRFVRRFIILWLSMTMFAFIVTLIDSVNAAKFTLSTFGPLGAFLFGYLLTMIGFNIESRKTKKDFQNLLKAKLVS